MNRHGQNSWILYALAAAALLWMLTIPGWMQDAETQNPAATAEVATEIVLTTVLTEAPTLEPTSILTEIPTDTAAPEPVIPILPTEDITPVPPEATTEVTVAPVESESTPEVTAEATVEIPILPTEEITLLPPEATAEVTVTPVESESTPTLTPLPVLTLVGLAHYQNRLPDDAGIVVTVRALNGQILSQTLTAANGVYSVAIPVNAGYWLRLAAAQHRPVELLLLPDTLPPEMWLAGGDLNQDGCINQIDVDLITQDFMLTESLSDINQDGMVSAVDIAILTGNFDAACTVAPDAALPSPTRTAAPEATAEPAPEVTPESTNAG